MGYIYFTRHGQSLWNIEKKICGATDIALSDLGREQASALGCRIREMLDAGEKTPDGNAFRIDEILYSPLSRTTETAQLIAEATGIPCRPEQRIIEQDFGRYEGLDRELEEFAADKMRFFYDFDAVRRWPDAWRVCTASWETWRRRAGRRAGSICWSRTTGSHAGSSRGSAR